MQRTYFIADAHLGAEEEEREQVKMANLLSFLHFVGTTGKALYICGDLFDFWFEYRHAVPSYYYQVLFKLSALVKSGVTIHYVAGNHDFWLRDFLAQQVGLLLHRNSAVTAIDSKKFFILHGDGLAMDDRGYRFLKKILQNHLNIFLFSLLHPDLGVPLARFCSRRSRNHTSRREYNDNDYLEFARQKIENGFDCVVYAHTHRPLLQKIGEGWVLNPGDWMKEFSYGVMENGNLSLQRWRPQG